MRVCVCTHSSKFAVCMSHVLAAAAAGRCRKGYDTPTTRRLSLVHPFASGSRGSPVSLNVSHVCLMHTHTWTLPALRVCSCRCQHWSRDRQIYGGIPCRATRCVGCSAGDQPNPACVGLTWCGMVCWCWLEPDSGCCAAGSCEHARPVHCNTDTVARAAPAHVCGVGAGTGGPTAWVRAAKTLPRVLRGLGTRQHRAVRTATEGIQDSEILLVHRTVPCPFTLSFCNLLANGLPSQRS